MIEVPEVDHMIPVISAEVLFHPRHQNANDAVAIDVSLLQQADGIADLGLDAIGADHEVGPELAAVGCHEHAFRRGANDVRIGNDIDMLAAGGAQDRGIEMLTCHGQHSGAFVRRKCEFGDDTVAVPCLVDDCFVRVHHDIVIGADCLEHAQAIFPDENAGAEGAQFAAGLMDPHGPTPLSQRDRGDQSGKAGSGDFGVASSGHAALPVSLLFSKISSRRAGIKTHVLVRKS